MENTARKVPSKPKIFVLSILSGFMTLMPLSVMIFSCQNVNSDCIVYDGTCSPLLTIVLFENMNTDSNSDSVCNNQGFCYIYSADNLGVGWSPSALGGVSGADAKCAAEKPVVLPGNSTDYKALIMATGGVRNQNSNWVLFANTQYRKQDNSILGTSNSSALLKFPLTSNLGSLFSINTGITFTSATSWTITGDNCLNWTGLGTNPVQGRRNLLTSAFIDNGTQACGSGAALYCVQTN